MAKDDSSPFRLTRSACLPEEVDFDPFGGDLDAQWAWKNFGDTSLLEAYKLLSTNPIRFAGDFMWIGPKAFTYYFPVMDRFVRDVVGVEEEDDEVECLGWAVQAHFDTTRARVLDSLVEEVEQLSAFVTLHYQRYLPPNKHHRGILRAWEKADAQVAEYKAQSWEAS